jgi:ketosteroid isomerase-like protein
MTGLSAFRRLLLAVALAPAVAYAADVRPAETPIPTVTRLVKVFAELEGELERAAETGDTAAIAAMLTDDFELRAGPAPGNPTSRADWIAAAHGRTARAAQVEQLAVHDLGDVAIASFLQRSRDTARPGGSVGDLFVVDVWKHAGSGWKLAIRYIGPAGGKELVIPGAAAATPTMPKRY